MDGQMGQAQMPQGQPAAQDMASKGDEYEQGTSIELLIAEDGSMTVSKEIEGQEDEANEAPGQKVANIDEALQVIKQMAQSVIGGESDEGTEDAAYKQEMAQQ